MDIAFQITTPDLTFRQLRNRAIETAAPIKNRCGDIVRRGEDGAGGDTGLAPSQIWYCGRLKNQCRCGDCDGRCGLIDGCPCWDCLLLLVDEGILKVNRVGRVARQGNARGMGGWTGLPLSAVWYCGGRNNDCRCGQCDGRCGRDNGCPCQYCLELLSLPREELRFPPLPFVTRTDITLVDEAQEITNTEGREDEGEDEEGGYDVEIEQGRSIENNEPHAHVQPSAPPVEGYLPTGCSSAVDESSIGGCVGVERPPLCRVCLSEVVQMAFMPCGHSCSCARCSARLSGCPICRSHIEQALRIYL